jgi:hypothetical protein
MRMSVPLYTPAAFPSGKNSLYIKVKVKVKFALEQATKTQRRSSGVALLFL